VKNGVARQVLENQTAALASDKRENSVACERFELQSAIKVSNAWKRERESHDRYGDDRKQM